jgi:calcineurin-like phosphoesterase family protein
MDEALITNWNSRVGLKDHVYHLGDFALGDVDQARNILRRLNGRIHFVEGNHDAIASKLASNFASYRVGFNEVKINRQRITLCHYAMKTWKKSGGGAWHLYGHSHGTLKDDIHSLSFDCGVDCHNYAPIHFDEVRVIMAKKNWKSVDHHGDDDGW